MDRFQVSDNPNGPWIELVVTNNPAHALEKARASFDWNIVWVAKMRPIMGQDLMPSKEIMHGEIMERLMTQHGGQVASQLEEEINISQLYDDVCNAATGHLLDVESEIMVPALKKAYTKDMSVKATDFTKPKPSLKDLYA